MILDALHRLANHRQSLSRAEARAVMSEVLTGQCTDAQIGALLVALHMKGETVEEIVGFAEAIRAAAIPLELHADSVLDASGTGRDALVDTCGTGGDTSGTFNISTATALVVAGSGVRVAKHGNRSVTSQCGSADVMQALGVNVDLPPARLAACLEEVGIAFLYAPAMHSAMKYVQPARRELRLRTVFNLLGPLTNPARATCQVVGVYSADLVEKLAEALSMLGCIGRWWCMAAMGWMRSRSAGRHGSAKCAKDGCARMRSRPRSLDCGGLRSRIFRVAMRRSTRN